MISLIERYNIILIGKIYIIININNNMNTLKYFLYILGIGVIHYASPIDMSEFDSL